MRKFLSGLFATTIALSVVGSSIIAAEAAPVFVPKTMQVTSDVNQVEMRRKIYRGRNFERHGNHAYYNGHRGYRYHRNGYREYNGFWFPAGAFIAGALITGAIQNNNNHSSGSAHVQWCYDHYRSYRASDNTFQPNYGSRRQCNSPYN